MNKQELGFQADKSVFNIQDEGDLKGPPILEIINMLKLEGYILDKIFS